MKETEQGVFNRIRSYALNVAWPYTIGYKDDYRYMYEEIQEVDLLEEERGYIVSGWNVMFYNDIIDPYSEDTGKYGDLYCFIALFKNGEINFFRRNKEQWLEEALDHYKDGQYKSSLFACEQILKLDSKNARAYHGKWLSLLKLKRFKEALIIYEQVITIAPHNFKVYYAAGNILHEHGRYEEALAAYNQTLQLNSRDSQTYLEKGRVLSELKHYKEALNAYNQALKFNAHNNEVYLEKWYVLLDLKLYEEALAVCHQAIQLDPNNIDSYKASIYKLEYMCDFEDALFICTQMLVLLPNDAELYYKRCLLLFRFKNLEEAFASIERSILISPTSHAYCAYGDILFELKHYEKALVAYEQSTNFTSTDSNNDEQSINLISDNNSTDEINDDSPHTYYYMENPQEDLYPYKDVILSYQNFIQHEDFQDDTERAYNKIGSLLYKLKHYEDALAAYNKAYRLNASSYYEKGCILFNFHHYEEALSALKQSINLDICNADAWRLKADILKLLNRPDASYIHYEAAKIVASWNGTMTELRNVISQLATAYTKNII